MADTKYTFSITSDFPNDKVNPTELKSETLASSITTPLLRIDTGGDVCDIWFTAALSGAEQATLNGLVAAHLGEVPLLVEDKIEGVPTGGYYETVGGDFPTLETWYVDNTKTKKIKELTITRDSNLRPTRERMKLYKPDGVTVSQTVTHDIVYSGANEQRTLDVREGDYNG